MSTDNDTRRLDRRHECDVFESDSGQWFARCTGCPWWVRKQVKTFAVNAALMHERQGVLVFPG